jgi:chaperonin GroEL
VATISSSNDEIGRMIGEAVYKAGEDGIVAVEESGSYDTYIEHADGYVIDNGYISPYLVTNPDRMEAVINKPLIAVINRDITTIKEIVALVDAMIVKSKNIVLIGEIGGDALNALIANKMKGVINCLVIRPPGYGENRAGHMEDIATVTGSTIFSKELGYTPEQFLKAFNLDWLGTAEKVIADKKSTIIIKGNGEKKDISNQVKNLKNQIKKASKPFVEVLEERIAKLTTGVSVVRVGAKTEIEAREKLERVKDAVGAAKAALQEGIVAGSGATFLRIGEQIISKTTGAKLLKKVLEQPIRKLMLNSGESDRKINGLVDRIKYYSFKAFSEIDDTMGYNVQEGKIDDMIASGIIDPARVIRLCLENGIGVATSILTTDTLIRQKEEQK